MFPIISDKSIQMLLAKLLYIYSRVFQNNEFLSVTYVEGLKYSSGYKSPVYEIGNPVYYKSRPNIKYTVTACDGPITAPTYTLVPEKNGMLLNSVNVNSSDIQSIDTVETIDKTKFYDKYRKNFIIMIVYLFFYSCNYKMIDAGFLPLFVFFHQIIIKNFIRKNYETLFSSKLELSNIIKIITEMQMDMINDFRNIIKKYKNIKNTQKLNNIVFNSPALNDVLQELSSLQKSSKLKMPSKASENMPLPPSAGPPSTNMHSTQEMVSFFENSNKSIIPDFPSEIQIQYTNTIQSEKINFFTIVCNTFGIHSDAILSTLYYKVNQSMTSIKPTNKQSKTNLVKSESDNFKNAISNFHNKPTIMGKGGSYRMGKFSKKNKKRRGNLSKKKKYRGGRYDVENLPDLIKRCITIYRAGTGDPTFYVPELVILSLRGLATVSSTAATLLDLVEITDLSRTVASGDYWKIIINKQTLQRFGRKLTENATKDLLTQAALPNLVASAKALAVTTGTAAKGALVTAGKGVVAAVTSPAGIAIITVVVIGAVIYYCYVRNGQTVQISEQAIRDAIKSKNYYWYSTESSKWVNMKNFQERYDELPPGSVTEDMVDALNKKDAEYAEWLKEYDRNAAEAKRLQTNKEHWDKVEKDKLDAEAKAKKIIDDRQKEDEDVKTKRDKEDAKRDAERANEVPYVPDYIPEDISRFWLEIGLNLDSVRKNEEHYLFYKFTGIRKKLLDELFLDLGDNKAQLKKNINTHVVGEMLDEIIKMDEPFIPNKDSQKERWRLNILNGRALNAHIENQQHPTIENKEKYVNIIKDIYDESEYFKHHAFDIDSQQKEFQDNFPEIKYNDFTINYGYFDEIYSKVPELYNEIGDMFVEERNYEEAESAYLNAIYTGVLQINSKRLKPTHYNSYKLADDGHFCQKLIKEGLDAYLKHQKMPYVPIDQKIFMAKLVGDKFQRLEKDMTTDQGSRWNTFDSLKTHQKAFRMFQQKLDDLNAPSIEDLIRGHQKLEYMDQSLTRPIGPFQEYDMLGQSSNPNVMYLSSPDEIPGQIDNLNGTPFFPNSNLTLSSNTLTFREYNPNGMYPVDFKPAYRIEEPKNEAQAADFSRLDFPNLTPTMEYEKYSEKIPGWINNLDSIKPNINDNRNYNQLVLANGFQGNDFDSNMMGFFPIILMFFIISKFFSNLTRLSSDDKPKKNITRKTYGNTNVQPTNFSAVRPTDYYVRPRNHYESAFDNALKAEETLKNDNGTLLSNSNTDIDTNLDPDSDPNKEYVYAFSNNRIREPIKEPVRVKRPVGVKKGGNKTRKVRK